MKKEIFQLTTSQGGRLARFSNPIRNELFQLTTSQGGRHNIILLDSAGNSFQLTTSQGGRPGTEKRSHQAPCISTLDLTRRSTGNCGASSATGYISTHDLARRSTGNCGASSATGYISTHDLARRSTLAIVRDEQVCYYFNSRPHEEVDASFQTQYGLRLSFQLTTSRGGRPASLLARHVIVNISTHDLTRRSTSRLLLLLVFQLHFNSRPHEEVDSVTPDQAGDGKIFQLTTSRRGRRDRAGSGILPDSISTHDLTKRSTKINITRIYL